MDGGRAHAYRSAAADRIVEEAVRGAGAEIGALGIPRLGGVVLGGGYGRGEGGVIEGEGGVRLYNDLDFYVVSEEGASAADVAGIEAALRPVGEKWTAALGVDADFCVKTPWRLRHDQERLMVQELVRGYCDVAGKSGEELFRGVERREAGALPWSEAVRLLANRGAGLLWARERQRGEGFIVRNLNKCVLGAGDARLIARGGYRWAAEDRAAALGDELYSRALAWKFRPSPECVCDWETARETWLAAVEEVRAAGRPARSLREAARWVARRRSVGPLRTLGFDPILRVLDGVEAAVRGRTGISAGLLRDWQVFN
jgi:hypothetical protein